MSRQKDIINKFIIFTKGHPYIFGLCLMIFSGIFLFFSIKSMIPPPAIVTMHRFKTIELKIRNALNETTQDKRAISSSFIKDLSMNDGWGYKITCKSKDFKSFKLISYGEDGMAGGKADLFYDFKI